VDHSLAVEVVQDRWRSGLDPEQSAQADLAIDLDAEETVCPACLTKFKPDVPMCPECGLRFG